MDLYVMADRPSYSLKHDDSTCQEDVGALIPKIFDGEKDTVDDCFKLCEQDNHCIDFVYGKGANKGCKLYAKPCMKSNVADSTFGLYRYDGDRPGLELVRQQVYIDRGSVSITT
jgi:hypothetical protein